MKTYSKSNHRMCSTKKCSRMFRKIHTEVCNFIKRETLAQLFSYEFCEIFKNKFFTEQLRVTASDI